MIRLVLVIFSLATIAVGLVQIRRADATVCHEIQGMQRRQVSLRRRLWEQQIRLGYLTAPAALRRQAALMALELADKQQLANR